MECSGPPPNGQAGFGLAARVSVWPARPLFWFLRDGIGGRVSESKRAARQSETANGRRAQLLCSARWPNCWSISAPWNSDLFGDRCLQQTPSRVFQHNRPAHAAASCCLAPRAHTVVHKLHRSSDTGRQRRVDTDSALTGCPRPAAMGAATCPLGAAAATVTIAPCLAHLCPPTHPAQPHEWRCRGQNVRDGWQALLESCSHTHLSHTHTHALALTRRRNCVQLITAEGRAAR